MNGPEVIGVLLFVAIVAGIGGYMVREWVEGQERELSDARRERDELRRMR